MKMARSATTTSLDEYELMGDAKYRSYVQQIDKALKGFEYTSEWADLVNALGKLNKVLLNNNKYNVIPRRFTVGQRLAQCMHPALPSGVHLKALETYDLIFKCIGTDRLIQELSIYSNGLFPLLSHAAINVKPNLLEIYEAHFVPLGQRLRPALDGFLIAVLPGLDEGADHHDRTDKLLTRVCDGVGHEYFYGSVWRCILNNPSVRLPATSYIVQHFNKKKSLEDQLHIMGTSIPTLITGVCAALLDANVLVQRAVLDLLLCCFPMHNCQVVKSDMINIATAAVTVLLRRDVSLNRRLCSWLFGPEPTLKSKSGVIFKHAKSSERKKSYFEGYSKELVLQAMKICLTNPSKVVPIPNAWSSLGDLWQYRLLICLFDHQDISAPLLDDLCVEILRALYHGVCQVHAAKLNKLDLLRTANLLFNNIGINYLWQRLSDLFKLACQANVKTETCQNETHVQQVGSVGTSVLEMCALVDFILDNVSVENYPELSTILLSLFLQHLLNCLTDHCSQLNCEDFEASIKLCSKIVSKIQPLIVQVTAKRHKSVDSLSDEKPNVKVNKSESEIIEEAAEDSSQTESAPPLLVLTEAIYEFFSVFVRMRLVQSELSLTNCYSFLCNSSTTSEREINFDVQANVDVNHNMVNVYLSLCQLLVEVCSLPVSADGTCNERLSFSGCLELPIWLQYLLVLGVYTSDSQQISYLSISTTLDLIAITKALMFDIPIPQIMPNSGSPLLEFISEETTSSQSTTKSTTLNPMVSVSELDFIYHQTSWFHQTGTRLWNNLIDGLSYLHLETATLFQQLHNLAVDSSVCDGIICNSMISPDESTAYEARRRFVILYNITRDLKVKSMPQSMTREFDRPLFFMLDNLTHKVNTYNAQSIDWLSQSLKNGDIARILEPILFILLHPDTSRVSVQHVNIHQPGVDTSTKNDEMDNLSITNSEAKIYAISSTGGNVIYHVNPDGRKRFSPSPNFPNKVLTLTSQLNSNSNRFGNKWITSKFNLPDYEVPPSHERNLDKYLSINMFLNPFGSMSSLNSEAIENYDTSSLPFTRSWPNLSSIRRFDGKSLKSDEIAKFSTPNSTPIASRPTTSCSTPIQIKKALDDSDLSDSEVIVTLLDELVDKVVEDLDESESEDSQTSSSKHTAITNSETISVSSSRPVALSQMHSHMLLYQQVYDSKKTLYAFSTLWNIILTDPQKVLFNMATTSISNRLGLRSQELQNICARHKNSLFGKGFYSELQPETMTSFRSSSFLEVVVTTCIHFIRGYYPSLPHSRLNEDEVLGNQKVRILTCEILRLIFSQLVMAVKGRATFSTYLHDMLMRCKVQKSVLQCLVSNVYNFQLTKEVDSSCEFADTIIEFNERVNSNTTSGFQEDLQKALLNLLQELMILEHRVAPSNMTTEKEMPTHNRKGSDSRAARIRFQPQMSSLKYYPNMLIPAQSMFLSSIQTALQQQHKVHIHANWLSLVEATLPFAGRSLSRLVICVLSQVCSNLEACSHLIGPESKEEKISMTPNYLNVLLKSLSTLCHFCLLDSSNSSASPPLTPQQTQQNPTNFLAPSTNPFQMISSFLHAFSTSDSNQDLSMAGREGGVHDPLVSTRKTVLSHLPRVLSAILSVWKAIGAVEKKNKQGWEIMGKSREVKQNILSFLSPISLIHGSNFMSSVAIIWYDLRSKQRSKKAIIPTRSEDQNLLVELIAAIRVLPMESVLQTMRQALKQPTSTSSKHLKRPPIEVCMLQFFLVYIKVSPGSQLLECWKSVLALLKDGLQISTTAQPLVQFHLLAILHEFVQAAPLIEDRKDQKDLQDVAQKLVDACTTIAGARLGQTKWLRRNLEVIPGPQSDTIEDEDSNECPEVQGFDFANNSLESGDTENSFLSKFSVQALCALAEFVAPVLDVVYVSEEKEKVVPLVSNIMYYVTPYLKNHSKHNAPSFRACSHLLSSISGYQYTRKAWRKDAFELLLDPAYFQMNSECFMHWKIIIDHLMTHDKVSFRDFLARMSVNQSGSLKLFSSKDQEIEQRANLVKRLAFILFCSERDQYQRYMTEIQEKLIESLRLTSSPLVQAQVLLCFRVIIMRMSSQHLTSLWPFIYTEMFQVFLHIEMELMTDTPEFSSHIQRLANLDSSWVTSQSNGLAAHNNPSWMQLYLEACKLLDLAIAMPADSLPQFQMYRWAFVGGNNSNNTLTNGVNKSALHPNSCLSQNPFEPHVVRINNLMNAKNNQIETLTHKAKCPLLTKTSIKNLLELHPFFHTILKLCQESSHSSDKPNVNSDLTTMDEAMNYIDKIVEVDFLEPLPND